MAAGEGKRLRPLTNTRPKVMLPVAGKPILEHLLIEAKKAGISEVVLIIRHLKEKIIEYFNEEKAKELGLKITFIEQPEGYGTASAILAAEKEIKDTFIALAGDSVTESSIIKSVIEGHKGSITLAVKKVKNPSSYGVVELSGDMVSLFEEKAKKPRSDLANISVYCMEPTVFEEIRTIPKSERGEYEIVSLFVGKKAVVVEGFWMDVAYPWHLFDANEHILSKMEAKTEEIENSTINGKVVMAKGSKIINSTIEGTVYVGENSVIGPNAYIRGTTAVGKNCHVGDSTTLKNSILFDKVNAKHLSYIGDSIIGEGVNFGASTQVANYRFDAGNINVQTEKGWVNSGRNKLGVIVGDNTKFGVLSCTMPGKIIGENCWISSNVTVNRNIASNIMVFVKQELHFMKQKEK